MGAKKKQKRKGRKESQRKRPAPGSTEDFALALARERTGALDEAATAYERFLAAFPQDPNAWFNLGRVRLRLGDLDAAADAFHRASRKRPDDPVCHATLGNALHLQGKSEEALACFTRAGRLAPNLPGIHAATANVLHRLNRIDEAVDALHRAVEADPTDPNLYHNLGHTLEKQGRAEAAEAVFRRAVSACPGHAGTWISLGNLLFSRGKPDEAVAALETAAGLAPKDIYALSSLARKLQKVGRHEEAAAAWRRVIDVDPAHPTANHMLSALTGCRTEKAPAGYVRDAFDLMARRFEDHLVGTLAYAVPTLLRKAVEQAAGPGARFAHALDMGCGTGLSGLAFDDIAQRMTGIDLSPGMLEKAQEKGVYGKLVEDDIVTFLDGTDTGFDLFIAADVMVYLGDLAPLFAAVRRRAPSGAYWVFSAECTDNREYTLTHSGRYAHDRTYVQRLAEENGFAVRLYRRENLRREGDRWVNGHLFVLQKRKG